MKTKLHWEQGKNLSSYHAAQNLAFQLREVAREKGFDPQRVKVLTKENADKYGSIADSMVIWDEGPVGWAYQTEFIIPPGVHVEPNNAQTVTFYDTFYD